MNSHDPFPEQTETGPFEAASPDGAPAAEATSAEPDAALVAENVALATENANLKDQVLRTLAEMENLRRRTEREVQDASRYAVTALARDVLSVGDNLGRALASVSAEARTAAGEALTSLLSGVEMTEREFVKTLGKHGVKRIEPAGERFDPNLHQAMFEVPDPSVTSGTIVQVMQPGYVIGDRVLRPALVGVAKGGPKAAPAGAAGETAGSAAGAR
jgi:molecular chaperone GrpE